MDANKVLGHKKNIYRRANILKFLGFSFIGICIYFIPFTLMGNRTILLDHLVSAITVSVPRFGPGITFAMVIIGGFLPFYEKTWNKDSTSIILSGLKLLGVVLAIMAFFNFGPQWLMKEDMLPLLLEKIIIPVALIIPLGSLFITFITGYGLLGFLGVLLKPVMGPVWKVPGIAAVNIVTSFVGSFSVGIFMTNKLLKEGKYTMREAAIITTGFSTVSAAFMVIVAKNLELMAIWNTFFWTTLIITFLVTAITVRLKPLNKIENIYITAKEKTEEELQEPLLSKAIIEALREADNAKSIWENMIINFRDGIGMSLRFLPIGLSVGLISFYAVKMTFLYDILAYAYYPIALLLSIPEPWLVAKASAIAGAEVLMPSLVMADVGAPIAARFATGVVSISSILFFSGSIPCILATEIDLKIKDILLILIERTALTLLLVAPVLKILF
ncbi:nucleoside recognition GATE domain-containing membrane protein YjiH [Natronincola peptidivorans]|uniref:Nucleoside recognition GATE domain-containing membrane protein YjiH n=1 Tax=Natronincola peptidivorans TaxID=426128 RepID=A0A1I0F5P8_9FIRM|nr:YjiH family protein [Natronincola peptidivorans]SET53012.1 nucleoside recognition GATE domain-containing membrane protein YjiH [Natronincola peptidivorans]